MNSINNQKAVNLFNKLADAYQKRFFSMDTYSDPLLSLLSYLKKDASVLDVACGPGNISHFLLTQNPHLKLLGIDLAPNMIELAKTNNPNARFEVFDAMEIDRLNKDFDAIISGFLFPYLSMEEVGRFIQKAHRKLSADGIIYVSTMEDLYENSRLKTSSTSNTGEQLMMHYYEIGFLVQLLEKTGFRILSQHTQPYVISETEKDTDLIIIAQKIGS